MIAAVVVLFNPNATLLNRLATSLEGQVDQVVVVDNSPQPSANIIAAFADSRFVVTYKTHGQNLGIATAQNEGIRISKEEGCSHVLLLDQDSALPEGMVDQLLCAERRLLESGVKVAAVGPAYIDEKSGLLSPAIRHDRLSVKKVAINHESEKPVEADYLISSGSMIRIEVLDEVGPMRDELFIDWVDIEWGLRARRTGFRHFIVPNAVLRHSIGDSTVRVCRKTINLHNDTRNCYIVRNATFLVGQSTMGWSWRLITMCKIPQYIGFYAWHSSNRARAFWRLCRSCLLGVTGRLGPLPFCCSK